MTPDEADALADELRQLAEDARMADAPRVEVTIERGLLDKEAVGAVLSEWYPFRSRKWTYNTSRLWNEIIGLDYTGWGSEAGLHFKFTVMCIPCGVQKSDCRGHHTYEHLGVPVSELYDNWRAMWGKSVAVYGGYKLLMQRMKVLASQ